jgi:hypothetical protein
LSLSAKSGSHSAVFFSHNKSADSTFCHGLSVKREILNFLQKNVSSLYDFFFFELHSMALKRIFIPSMVFRPFSALNGVKWRVKRP